MPLKLKGATSGEVIVEVPATAGSNTATFPAASGNCILDSQAGTLTSKTLSTGCTTAAGVVAQGTSQSAATLATLDFSNIPSWVKRITVAVSGLTGGAQNLACRLGTGSTPTYVATGYVSADSSGGSSRSNTTYFLLSGRNTPSAADAWNGICVLTNLTGNVWTQTGICGSLSTGQASITGGSVDLGAPLTSVRIGYANFTTTFTGGSVNIIFE